MAYAPSFTARYIGTYRCGGRNHNIQVRAVLGEPQATTVTRGQNCLHNLMEALKGKLADDFIWISAKYIPEDSEVGVPVATPTATTGALALNTFSKEDRIRPLHFPGHSTNSPGGLYVYGVQLSPDVVPDGIASDYLITASEDTDIAAAIAALSASNIAGNDGTVMAFYSYATTKPNDFYVKKVRKGL